MEVIRLSPGETSPSDKAGISVLSSCYKTDWPTAIGGRGEGHWDNTFKRWKPEKERCHQRIWVWKVLVFLQYLWRGTSHKKRIKEAA